MNRSQIELARENLGINNSFLGEQSYEVANSLNTELKGSETSPEEAIDNLRLTDRIIGLLALAKIDDYTASVVVQSPALARATQSTVLWFNPPESSIVFSHPSYVIGERRHHGWSDLLLHGLHSATTPWNPYSLPPSGITQTATVRSRPYSRWHPSAQPLPNETLSESEFHALRTGDGYRITKDSIKSMKLYTYNRAFHRTRGLLTKSLVLRGKLGKPLKGMTNEMLASYKVFDHLNGLAICFNKVDEVDAVIKDSRAH